ncbi:DUF6338 family protein [Klebsiella quasipneumoniae]|uniref:DUF6338 family protein n=1 Tax=Klebsiella quasipneumoniae TaxID=1463165 RepID=UPI0021484067|nr:DUF6338 family protein [Klebsiella quasipneumoniae]MCR1231192.1 DUF6338 family protein [Klebsiella quasipneumoniae]
MDIWDKSKLLLFIVFVIPGFLSMKIYSILHPNSEIDMSKAIVEVVSYSCINYAIWFYPIYFIESNNYFSSPVTYCFFYLVVLFVSPIALSFFLVWMRTWKWLGRFLPHPTGRAWDYFFSLRKPAWVIITLKDGKKIGGKFSQKSFASSAPNPEQLYLEENWVINDDGGLERPRNETFGVLILSRDIESIEFFEYHPEVETTQ